MAAERISMRRNAFSSLASGLASVLVVSMAAAQSVVQTANQNQTQTQNQNPKQNQAAQQGYRPQTYGIGNTSHGDYINLQRPITSVPGYIFVPPVQPQVYTPRPRVQVGPYVLEQRPPIIIDYPGHYGGSYNPYISPVYTEGSSISVGGGYSDGKWRVNGRISLGTFPNACAFGGAWNLNSAYGSPDRWYFNDGCSNRVAYLKDGWGPRPYFADWFVRQGELSQYTSNVTDAARSMQYQSVQQQADAAQVAAQAAETTLERARHLMSESNPGEAAKSFRKHLKTNPDDAIAMRQFAVALLDAGQIDDGIAVMRSAYRIDSSLADMPMTPDEIGMSKSRLRSVLTRTVGFANRLEAAKSGSASAWLTVTALMQAEGRVNLAKQMLDRSVKSGLDRETAEVMRTGLSSIH
jgi:tetratricopeptide (TPR) repeat protein